jgi:UDP-N-acetylmuramoyl-tripeptide--D-alanyl-D-alanine ligase
MKPTEIEKLIQILHAEAAAPEPSKTFTGVSIDSRSIKPGQSFFAIPGENFDGRDFIPQAIKNGAACVVSQKLDEKALSIPADVPLLIVDDSVAALGKFAAWYRRQLAAKVIAITGSAGKTTTRQIVYHCLKEHFDAFTSPKNFNNDVGLPLALFMAQDTHEILVLELASNAPGEIAMLSKIANPDLALITNVYPTHLQGLGSIQGIIKEKASIYKGLSSDGRLFINADFPDLLEYCKTLHCRIITFGTTEHSQINAFNLNSTGPDGTLTIENTELFVPLPGVANLHNTLAAWSVCKFIGLKLQDFANALEKFSPPQMRMQIQETSSFTIINDCYNANPASMKNALDCLQKIAAQKPNTRSVFICGQMAELGTQSEKFHQILGKDIAHNQVRLLLAVGPFAKTVADNALAAVQYPLEAFIFENTAQLCDNLQDFVHKDDIILIKGSRTAKLEKAVEKLKAMSA